MILSIKTTHTKTHTGDVSKDTELRITIVRLFGIPICKMVTEIICKELDSLL